MVTTELRRDPITGRSVLIDVGSQPSHPSDFLIEPVSVADANVPPCAFCEGREAEAGQELLAWRMEWWQLPLHLNYQYLFLVWNRLVLLRLHRYDNKI